MQPALQSPVVLDRSAEPTPFASTGVRTTQSLTAYELHTKGRVMTRAPIPVLVLIAALVLGVATNLFFYGQSLGISVPLFVLLLFGALVVLSRPARVRAVRPNL